MQFRSVRLIALGLCMAACGEDKKEPLALVSSEVLDFGHATCGTTQAPRKFSLGNSGLAPFNFTTSFTTGTQYMVQPSSGFVLPGQQVELTVFSAAIPQHSAITENLYADTLVITTDIEDDTPREIPITQTARGAILELVGPVVVPTIKIPGDATASMKVRNTGNAPATDIELAVTGTFSIAPKAIAQLAPGAESASTVTYHALEQGSFLDAITISHANGLCAPLPAPLVARAEGTFANTMPMAISFVPYNGRSSDGALFVHLADGHVASLGDNLGGVRGSSTLDPNRLRPTLVWTELGTPLDGVTSVVGARSAACARRTDGSAWCWGNRSLGRSNGLDLASSVAVRHADDVKAIAMGYGVFCSAASADGDVTCEASDERDFTRFNVPTDLTGATALSVHPHGGYVLNGDGTVTSFGSNAGGERGNTDGNNAPPSLVTGLTDVAEIVAMGSKPQNRDRIGACARKTDGTVWCWGDGRNGRLGNGTTPGDSSTPVQVLIDADTPLTGVTALSGSHGHRCATTPTNVYCWGRGGEGRLGRANASTDQGNGNPWAQPTEPAITGGISVITTQRGTCVLRATGQIICFGQTPFSNNAHASIDAFTEAL